MKDDFQQKFLKIIGSSYQDYGFPPICGWIEALLGIKKKGLTQVEISYLLSTIMDDKNIGTSVSSVNRALKILVPYGSVIRKGTAKEGYQYELNTNPEFFDMFIQNFINVNKITLRSLEKLKQNCLKAEDTNLIEAIENEIVYLKYMDDYLIESKKILDSFKKKYFKG
ncbi:MAG: hypothetical protein ACFFCV_21795 [Promethearchaeota archaeon]